MDSDLAAASATPIVLAVLAEGEHDGYTIVTSVRERAGGALAWSDGMLYPLLQRLHRLGYVTADWRTEPDGRGRRYYAITREGRNACARRTTTAFASDPAGTRTTPRQLIVGRRPRDLRLRPFGTCDAVPALAVAA